MTVWLCGSVAIYRHKDPFLLLFQDLHTFTTHLAFYIIKLKDICTGSAIK